SSEEMAQNKDATAAQTVPSSQISESNPENETVQKEARTIQVKPAPGSDLGAPT
ncbi:hypothetical protein RRG08_063860, partial [Elysia crispata]